MKNFKYKVKKKLKSYRKQACKKLSPQWRQNVEMTSWRLLYLDKSGKIWFSDSFATRKRRAHACSCTIFKYDVFNYMNEQGHHKTKHTLAKWNIVEEIHYSRMHLKVRRPLLNLHWIKISY